MDDRTRAITRRSLHGLAELVLAGPQFRSCGRIELKAAPGGFATVAEPQVRLAGVELVTEDTRLPVGGRTYSELAAAIGLTASGLDDVYKDGPGCAVDDVCHVDPAAAEELARAFELGDVNLRRLASVVTPVLWPEHFDIAIELERVNFGVSPGDGFLPEPYAYVGPWQRNALADDFWNAPFGAARPLSDLADSNAVFTFFTTGRDLLRSLPGGEP
jgi:hypothetical protein